MLFCPSPDTGGAAEGEGLAFTGSRLLTPQNARQGSGEGLVSEGLPGSRERRLEGVRSPPGLSLTLYPALSHSLVSIKGPQELCNSVQDLVYFDVCATETQSIKF